MDVYAVLIKACGAAVLVALTAVLTSAPVGVLIPVLVAAGVFSMSWNSTSRSHSRPFPEKLPLISHEPAFLASGSEAIQSS